MDENTAVLDADVLIPAAPRDTLLRAAEGGLFVPLWSVPILDEVYRNLHENRLATEESARRLIVTLEREFSNSLVIGFDTLIASMTDHHDDRHVLAAAVHARSSTIVTGNSRHFPQHSLQPHRVHAVSVDTFLMRLCDVDRAEMAQIVVDQASELRRPQRSVSDVLDSLSLHAPDFADAIRRDLGLGKYF